MPRIQMCRICAKIRTIYERRYCCECFLDIIACEQDEYTEDAIEAMIDEMLPTMCDKREERDTWTPQLSIPRARPAIRYEASPHGENCPLLPLLDDVSVTFTVAVMRADKWLRSEECRDMNADGFVATTEDHGDTITIFAVEKGEFLEVAAFDSVLKTRKANKTKAKEAMFEMLMREEHATT